VDEGGGDKRVNTPHQNRKKYTLGAVNYPSGEVLTLFSSRKGNVAFASLAEIFSRLAPITGFFSWLRQYPQFTLSLLKEKSK
jgi:hypothetical protein